MRARLAINNCFATKRWPRPADWAGVIRDELGLARVELSLDLLDGVGVDPALRERTVEATRSALAGYGLHAEATFTGLAAYSLNLLLHPDPEWREEAMHWYRDVIEVTARLGAPATGGHVGAMSVPDFTDPARRSARWDSLKHDLRLLAHHARAAGLDRFLVENLASPREPSTTDQIEDLLSAGDAEHVPIQLCLDVGHQCVPGTAGAERDPYAWLRRFGAVAGEVQLQQSDAEGDHHWPFTPARNAAGRIDPGRVLDALAAGGAGEVLVVLEVIPAAEEDDAQVVAGLRSSVEVWQGAIHEGGFDG